MEYWTRRGYAHWLGLSLAANTKSMEAFARMSDSEKKAAVEKSRQMHTKADMEKFVNSLGE